MKLPSLSWMRGKQSSTTGDTQALSDSRKLTSQPDQKVSLLLALPNELQQRIFDFIAIPWSMAILLATEQDEHRHELDSTIALRNVGSEVISGPPGYSLLLTCRAIYQNFHPRYGSHCTGHLVLGQIKGRMRRKLPDHLALESHIRFNNQIQKISLSFAADWSFSVGYNRFGPKFRKLFPNVRRADCLVHEGSYGPLLGERDLVNNFLSGRYDEHVLELTKPAVNYHIGSEGSSFAPLFSTSKPWNDEQGVVDVKVLGSSAAWDDAIVARIKALITKSSTNPSRPSITYGKAAVSRSSPARSATREPSDSGKKACGLWRLVSSD